MFKKQRAGETHNINSPVGSVVSDATTVFGGVSPATSPLCSSTAEPFPDDVIDDEDVDVICEGNASDTAREFADICARESALETVARQVGDEVWPDGPRRTDKGRSKITEGVVNRFYYTTFSTPLTTTDADSIVAGFRQLFAIPQIQHINKKRRGEDRDRLKTNTPDANEWAKQALVAADSFKSRHPTWQLFFGDLLSMLRAVQRRLAENGIQPLQDEACLVNGAGGSTILLPFPPPDECTLMRKQRLTISVMRKYKNKKTIVKFQPSSCPQAAIPVVSLLFLEFMRINGRFRNPQTGRCVFDLSFHEKSCVWVGRTSAMPRSPLRDLLCGIGHAVLQIPGYRRTRDCKEKERPDDTDDLATNVHSPNAFAVGQISLRFVRTSNVDGPDESLTFAERASNNERKHIKATVNINTGETVWIASATRTIFLPAEVPLPIKVISRSISICEEANLMDDSALLLSLFYARLKGHDVHLAGTEAMLA